MKRPNIGRFRAVLVPLLSFLAGIATVLISQTLAGRQQLVQARRENRVTALREYASACSRTVVSLVQLANWPLHVYPLDMDKFETREKKTERSDKLLDEATTAWRHDISDLAVQTDVVNALFRAKVDPIGVISKNGPTEFNVLPGTIDPEKIINEDPSVLLRKYLPMLGQQSVDLSSYCKTSVQTLSHEID